eukprot:SAG11_NODE_1835_length_4188_cov_2.482514_6_plen_51_part_01
MVLRWLYVGYLNSFIRFKIHITIKTLFFVTAATTSSTKFNVFLNEYERILF